MSTYLPALQIILPLISAPVCLVLRKARAVWIFAMIVCALALVFSVILLATVLQSGALTVSPGAWASSVGIELRIDYLSAYALLGLTAVSTVVMASAAVSVSRDVPQSRHALIYICLLCCLAGLSGVLVSGDLITAFVFLEIAAFSAYIMIGFATDARAMIAGFRYFVLGTIGSGLILLGILAVYTQAGTVNMQAIPMQLSTLPDAGNISVVSILMVAGLCLKLGLFPFHLWLPPVYRLAPMVVTAFLATAVTQVSVYFLLRLVTFILGGENLTASLPVSNLLIVVSLVGILVTSIIAIYQEDMKLLLAYSTLAQISFLVLGFSMGNPAGLMASSIQLLNHALINGALFLTLSALIYRTGSSDIRSYAGLGRQMPWTMAAFVVAGLSLIGIPLTAGFTGKWYLVLAALEDGHWLVITTILAGSVLTLVYIWKVIETLYLEPAGPGTDGISEAPAVFLVPLWFLAVANLWLGIDTRLTVGISQLIVQGLFGTSL